MTASPEPKAEAEPLAASPDSVEDTAQEHEQENGLSSPSLPQSSSTRSLTDHRLSNGSSSVTTPRAEDSPASPIKADESASADAEDRNEAPETQETPKRQTQQKSPLLTAHRLSTSSSLDDVNLTGSNNDAGSATASPGPETTTTTNTTSTTTSDSPAVGSPSEPQSRRSLQSTIMSSLPWSSSGSNSNSKPPTPTTSSSSAAAPSSGRKLTSPFSWLSRSSSKEVKSPPSSLPSESRRNTATSIASLSSVPEMLGRLPENDEDGDAVSTSSRRPARNSLKDQFKMLRMREESGEGDRASVVSGTASAGPAPPGSSSAAGSEDQSRPATANAPTVNPNLPPGTVSGIAASAADASAPVDWDLWAQIVNHGPEALKGTNSAEISAAIRKGIPQTIRGVIWQVLADSRDPDLEEEYKNLVARGTDKERERSASINGHAGLVSEKGSLASSRSSIRSESSVVGAQSSHAPSPSPSVSQDGQKKTKYDAEAIRKLEKTIRRDLGFRTSYSRYFISQGNQEALFGLCKAYALYDEAVGYAQGINFIAMPLLFNMDECEAFTLLVKLMFKYGLREMFLPDMPGLHLHLYQFERLLEDLEPALYCHLRRRGVSPQLYATQWFLTLFAYRFPLQLVLRIYDFIFEEGLESTILRFGIAIMRRNAETLLEMKDMSSLSHFLKERLFDVYIDRQPSPSSILESGFFGSSGNQDREVYRADVMVQDAIAVPLTADMIETYTAEWSEKVRAEKEREAELESLRQTVAAQAARIRQLEEQAERTDKEHVQLASELVRLKVENEELHDKNESLLGSVEELKSVVDKQPAEVEERLRTEMERIMQRNIEVQNENRSMEEQLAEMERDLVATKMKWAELSENHESLKQKWADLRRALDG